MAGLTVGGQPMNAQQHATAQIAMGVANKLQAGSIASIALIYAGIGESNLSNVNTWQSNNPSSTQNEAAQFLQGTGDFSNGGAIHLARISSNPIAIANAVENNAVYEASGGNSTTFVPGTRDSYATHWPGGSAQGLSEAKSIVAAFGGATIKGGVAGASSGGSGTIPDGSTATTYPFSIGGTDNPDEDFWTGINRLAQEVNWYLFTSGEYLYYLDGQEMLAQQPAMHLDRVDDAGQIYQSQGSLNYDNTAFNYVSDHKRRFHNQRRTKVAMAQSPTEAPFELLCGIDEVLGGDVMVLSGFGPGDGRWIVGEVRRSVFQPYSEITLVPALAPITEAIAAGTTGVAGSKGGTGAVLPGKGGTGAGSGGLVNPAPGATGERLDMGCDGNYSGQGLVAPYNGTVHFDNRGWPGEGNYIWIKNDDQSGANYTLVMYFAEGAKCIVPDGTHVTAGTKIGTPVASGGNGSFGNFEIGAGNTTNGDPLAKELGLGSTAARNMVLAFSAWLQSVGFPKPNQTSNAGSP